MDADRPRDRDGRLTAPARRFRRLPKAELHRHFEGALRLRTLWEFHRAWKQALHTGREALRRALMVGPGDAPSFTGFLARFAALRFRFGGPAEIARLAREVVADAAEDGVAHLELRFSPVFVARRMQESDRGPSSAPPPARLVERAAEMVVRAASAEARRRRVSLVFILSLNRAFGREVARAAANLLRRPVGAAFAAVDVAGDESAAVEEMAEFLALWRKAGRKITLHAGEDPRGDGAARVREAIAEYGADRIGHGVRAAEDPATMRFLVERGAPLELCLTSNLQTGAVRDARRYPLREFLEQGVAATLNTDDPTLCGTRLSLEYARAAVDCGLDDGQLRHLALNAVRAAFLPPDRKAEQCALLESQWRG